MDWRHKAVCRDEDPELFFPVGNSGPALAQIADAKLVCNRCPVTTECLTWALDSGQDAGVWGGMGEDERRALKRRNARTKARSGPLELILSDVNMPGLRGPDLVTELKAAGILCPVLFTSGDPSFEVVDSSLQVPGATFLPKPFSGSELVDAVYETLGQR